MFPHEKYFLHAVFSIGHVKMKTRWGTQNEGAAEDRLGIPKTFNTSNLHLTNLNYHKMMSPTVNNASGLLVVFHQGIRVVIDTSRAQTKVPAITTDIRTQCCMWKEELEEQRHHQDEELPPYVSPSLPSYSPASVTPIPPLDLLQEPDWSVQGEESSSTWRLSQEDDDVTHMLTTIMPEIKEEPQVKKEPEVKEEPQAMNKLEVEVKSQSHLWDSMMTALDRDLKIHLGKRKCESMSNDELILVGELWKLCWRNISHIICK